MSEDLKIKSNVQIEKDLTVTGDLTVDGTTTSVNSATLEVTDANITVNDGGDQASADSNDAGLTVEMSDANDAIVHYDSTSATKWKVGDTAATADVVDISTAQGISNKTLTSTTIDASLNTVSNVDVTTDITGTLPVGSGGTGSTTQTDAYDALSPATTKGDITVHNGTDNIRVGVGADGEALVADAAEASGVKWGTAGGGAGVGGINYLTGDDFNFANTIGNWATYDDGVASEPVDGTLGSPSVISIARNTSTPLVSPGDLRISKSAADGQGEGASIDLTAEEAFKSSVNKIEFLYTLSTPGSFVTGADSSVQVFLYDVTNAALVPLSNEDITGQSGKFRATFVGTGSTSYRLILHITDTVATAWALDIDNVVVGPNDDVRGVPASDPQIETITFRGTTSDPVKSGGLDADVIEWYRVGKFMHCRFLYRHENSAGTGGSGDTQIEIPGGFSIDMSNFTGDIDSSIPQVGQGAYNNTSGTTVEADLPMLILVDTATRVAFYNTELQSVVPSSNFVSNSVVYEGFFSVPISGWSSDVSMANGSTFRMSNVLANGTHLTASNPTKLGEYATYIKDASAFTYTQDTTAPTVTATDGMRIYADTYATAGTAGQPTKWVIFVGKQKHVRAQWYSSAGKTGHLDVSEYIFSSNAGQHGVAENYDPSTGLLVLDCPTFGSAISTRAVGTVFSAGTGGPTYPSDGYFDIVVSENALAVGVEAPRSEVNAWSPNGYGSTATAIRKYSNSSTTGAAISYTSDAVNGDSFTINEDGIFSINATDSSTAGHAQMGISLNSASLTTIYSSLTKAEQLAFAHTPDANEFGQVSVTTILSKGDVIRFHDSKVNTTTSQLAGLRITQVSK